MKAILGESVVAMAASFGPADLFGLTFLSFIVAAMVVSDLRTLRLPDILTGMMVIVGFLWLFLDAGNWSSFRHDGVAALARMAICATVLLLLREVYYRYRGRDGLGLGDVKLCSAGAVWLPFHLLSVAILAASVAALIAVFAVQLAGEGWHGNRRIPLGACLAPAIWLAWLARMVSA